MRISRRISVLPLALLAGACATMPLAEGPADEVPVFAGDTAIDRFIDQVAADRERLDAAYPIDTSDQRIIVTGSSVQPPNITNVQEAGVDEGGIVKLAGDYLVVLRRGRLFTLRHAGGALEAVDHVDVFPPSGEDPDDAWYDEMLTMGNRVITIGYAYGEDGTELSRFDIDEEGKLHYVDTHYLNSGDYYSSRNYAGRLIDGQMLFYSPYRMGGHRWRDGLPQLTRLQADGTLSEPVDAENSREFAVPRIYAAQPKAGVTDIHSVTSCDVMDPAFTCSSRMVVGGGSRNFYMSRQATYIWTNFRSWRWPDHELPAPMLYRIPHDQLDPITAIQVEGSPIDQFSFLEDMENEVLHVVVEGDDLGDEMWASEYWDGPIQLLQIPLAKLGDGSASAPAAAYRELPEPPGYRMQNRYVGRFLIYASSSYRDDDNSYAFAAPLDRRWVQRIPLPHGTSRLDRLGDDAVAIGVNNANALGFSSIYLDQEELTAQLASSYLLEGAREGERRSQAFYFLPDTDSPDGQNGTMALPVTIEQEDEELYDKFGNGSAVFFLRREQRELLPAGQLDAANLAGGNDGCIASCVDWYGNARPIFLGDRVFGLIGYELVEGNLADGQISEVRRVNFTPSVD